MSDLRWRWHAGDLDDYYIEPMILECTVDAIEITIYVASYNDLVPNRVLWAIGEIIKNLESTKGSP